MTRCSMPATRTHIARENEHTAFDGDEPFARPKNKGI